MKEVSQADLFRIIRAGLSRGHFEVLHYQLEHPQGKLARVTEGEVFDVAVDLRKSSPSFGKWVGRILSHKKQKNALDPPGICS